MRKAACGVPYYFMDSTDTRPALHSPNDMSRPSVLASHLSQVMEGLGVAEANTRQSLDDICHRFFHENGYDAQVTALRYGTLVITASSRDALLLNYDQDRLKRAVNTAHPELVSSILVRAQAPSRDQ